MTPPPVLAVEAPSQQTAVPPLAEIRDSYRRLVEDMQQGAVTVSAGGDIVYANPSFAAMVGRPLAEVLHSTLESHVSTAHLGRLRGLLAARVSEPDVELTLAGSDGGIEVRMSVVSRAEGMSTLLVTDLGQARALHDAQAVVAAIDHGRVDAFVVEGAEVVMLESGQLPYRYLVERMRQGAMAISEGLITYANERIAAMLGVSRDSLLGARLDSLVAEADHEAVASLLSAAETGQAEIRLRTGAASLATLTTLTRLEGQCLLLFSDITLEKRHRATDERTRAFLGLLAEEFLNILEPIRASADALRRAHPTQDETLRAVSVIERQEARLSALAEELRRINPRD